MRRPITLNKPERQQGYALFIVLMMMVVIALLVVTATQSYNTEQRISTNDADRKLATTLAEAALREGENQIFDIEGKKTTFTKDCKNGLCSTPEVIYDGNFEKPENDKLEGDAWNRILPECIEKDEKDEKKKKKPQKCIDVNGKKYSLGENSGIKKSPRYIIEYLGTNSADKRTIYRVTAKAWGKNDNTQVVLQSYVASE
ncbi:pilus assembly protein PilX [Neisseria perflava]|uniref:Pilus assembly protein n=1 Tax=Neisseria perflava TaxID=33053 RepID=A0A9X7F9D1_NEIPE|nr:pilus assembly protein [Neisseria perflava]PLA50286.1 pilus assembly protein PilX [Neisseria perflava]WOS98949.1 pilus assembly protein [Neisseria perflava]